jgi:hypothetical protein
MSRSHSTAQRRLGPNAWIVCQGPRFSIKEERVASYLVPPVQQRLAISNVDSWPGSIAVS